jgi:hypothetical protein
VNPYLATAIAMCTISIIAIILTAYLATHMNRKAKADLAERLQPLADLLNGELLPEEVTVRGRWQDHIAEGRMANALDGPGRVFFTRIIDAAGGVSWTWTSSAPKNPEEPREIKFTCAVSPVCNVVEQGIAERAEPFFAVPGWTRVEYDVEAGHIRLTKPMMTRNDIPGVEAFRQELETLVDIGVWNRELMQPEAPLDSA